MIRCRSMIANKGMSLTTAAVVSSSSPTSFVSRTTTTTVTRCLLSLSFHDKQQILSTPLMNSISCSSSSNNNIISSNCSSSSSSNSNVNINRWYSSQPLLLHSARPASAAPTTSEPIRLPSNLKMDPKSSFLSSSRQGGNNGGVNTMNHNKNHMNKKKSNFDNKKSTTNKNNSKTNNSNLGILRGTFAKYMGEQTNDEQDQYDDDYDDDHVLIYPNENTMYAKPLPERLKVDVHSLFNGSGSSSSSSDGSSSNNTVVGTIWLNPSVFGCDPIRVDLLKRAVDYCRAKKRGIRKAHTKTISEVRGSGRKMRQQKGTGKARMGHRRPAHHRGGAKAHGPNKNNNTNYANTKLNKKVRKLAMKHALSTKLKEGNLILVNEIYSLPSHKTKELVKCLQLLQIGSGSSNSSSSSIRTTTAILLDHYYPQTIEATSTSTSTSTTDQENDPDKKNEENDEEKNNMVNTSAVVVPPLSVHGVPVNVMVASKNISHHLKVRNTIQGMNVYDLLKYDKLILTLDALQEIENRFK